MDFEAIAILHSNIIKQGLQSGYVITTGDFTKNAREYAEGLNIELINGVQLVDLWLEGLENGEQEIKQVIPEYV
ncbi:restriction endonuclease [Bacillus sp. AFS017274]|uniref:restriction endonuclease n=1 Tax=Bacillaceae TaxID=186817 RepID=UPI00256FD207|nr:restriction endonuclease [Bacillus sp. AFS017274]